MFRYLVTVVYNMPEGPHVIRWAPSRLRPMQHADMNRVLRKAKADFPGADSWDVQNITEREYLEFKNEPRVYLTVGHTKG